MRDLSINDEDRENLDECSKFPQYPLALLRYIFYTSEPEYTLHLAAEELKSYIQKHWKTMVKEIKSQVKGFLVHHIDNCDYQLVQILWPLMKLTGNYDLSPKAEPTLPILKHLVHLDDEEVLTDVFWGLSTLSGRTNIRTVIELSVCKRLVELLKHPSPSIVGYALQTIGNLMDDHKAQCFIEYGALPCLLSLLTNNHKTSIKEDACWAISNFTTGNNEQIQAVIVAGLIAPLVNLVLNGDFEIKKQAAWAILYAILGGNNEQIKYLVNQGCIKPLCDLLSCSDPMLVTLCLKGLKNILKVGEAEKNLGHSRDANIYAQLIRDAEGLEKIENLRSHDSDEIQDKAVKVLETYWSKVEDEPVDDLESAK